MFKNRKSTILHKKPSDLASIKERTEEDGQSSQKIQRLESGKDNEDHFSSSQFSVPASQVNSQRRYLSQRNNLQKSQSARTSRRVPTNYFESILLKCQLDLDDPTCIVLKCEPIMFVRRLRTMLQSNPEYPRNVKDFVHGVELASKSPESFRKLLECCQFQNQTTHELKPLQESVMKLLLCIDFVQLELIKLLLNCVEKAASENSDIGMTGMILSQIKFIDHTVHGTFVFNKFFEVLERSGNIQLFREAIASLKDVIDVSMHDLAFRKIVDLLPAADDLFTATNITVFCEMCLSSATLRMTRQKIVDLVESGCPVEIYPLLIKFLLKYNISDQDDLHENIQETRQVVDRLVQIWNGNSSEKYLLEIFQMIYQALTVSTALYDAWLKFCRLLTDEESHMSLDLLILLMMLSVNEIKSNGIQKILINKIKRGHLTVTHMKELTKYFGCVLKVHMDCVLDFVESCLKERQIEICEFGVTSISYLFSADNMNNKVVLNKLVGFMCEMALVNEGRRNDHLIATCMNALSNINSQFPNDIKNNAHVLLKIMDVSIDLSLQQYRTAVSLICDAIDVPETPLDESETWDNINIVIRKQLLSNKKDVKKKGIIGVVRLVQHLLKNTSGRAELHCSFDSEKTIESASDIPTAAGREIANMINMMLTSANESTEILGLCYDEIADMLREFETNVGQPEKAFTIWLCDVITNEFQVYFITEEIPKENSVHFAKKLCINDTSDVENTNAEAYAIAVNISENILTMNSRYSSMCFFLSMFKLMKSLQSIRYNGNLESINALLGCSVIVPTFYDEPDEENLLDNYEEHVCRQLFDVYFYVSNWFRELLNAFIEQKDPLLHRKVLQRLTALVQLEQRLSGLLRAKDFEYHPPTCDFSVNTQTKPAKPTKESSSKQNITINTTKTQPNPTQKNRTLEAPDFSEDTIFLRYRSGFRVMEKQLVQLLRDPVLLCRKLPNDKIGTCLSLSEYRFLLETITTEMESRVVTRTNHLSIYKPKDIFPALPSLVENYSKIKMKLYEYKHSKDANIQLEQKALSCCFNWTLRMFTAILQIVECSEETIDAILEPLAKLSIPADDTMPNTENTVQQILTTELTHKNAFKNLHSASCLYKFGQALNNFISTRDGTTIIATFCQKFICTNFQQKTGSAVQLALLLQGVFVTVNYIKIKKLTNALGGDLDLSKSDERNYVGLQRGHYALLFKELCKAFIKCTQGEMRAKKTTVQKFVSWEQSSEILKQFSDVAKQADNFKIYCCYMKYAHTFLKLFQQYGLRTLEDVLKVSADRVSHLLSTLQHSTRYLHNICCHSKSAKDKTLAAQIPFIRETVETLIYSVKAVLAANDCASVFWMGNLKNKDLKGMLIISQEEPDDVTESNDSDIADFLSDDEENQLITSLRAGDSGDKSSQSKCF